VYIVSFDRWGREATSILAPVAAIEYHETYNPHKLMSCAEGLIASLHIPVTWRMIDSMPELRFIASCTTGLDHIDVAHARTKGIRIISLNGERGFLDDVYATAEHTWALVLALIRKIPWAHQDVLSGDWNRERWQGTELRGKTLGIVGMGRVGRQVAIIGQGFGMRVLYCDVVGSGSAPLQDLLRESDIVSVHVPLDQTTKGMCNAHFFETMKSTAYFVNTSRGAVVDERALINALRAGKLAGAALDVVCHEAEGLLWDSPLFRYADVRGRLLITPHIAGNTRESREKTQVFIAEKIRDFIERERINVHPPAIP